MTSASRTLIAAAVASVLLVVMPSVVFAHAGFVRSDPPDICGPLAAPRLSANDPRCQTGLVLPTPPASVSVSFSEPISVLGPGIRVLSPSGKRVDRPPAHVDGSVASVDVDTAEQGTYIVQWQIMSGDTHPARGQFAFSVGQTSQPAVSPEGLNVGQVTPIGLALQTLARWLHLGGYALAFGTLGWVLLTASPVTHALLRLSSVGIVVLLAAEPVALLGQTASLGLDLILDGDAMGDALASSFGRLMGFRVAAALLLWVVTGGLRPSPAAGSANSIEQPRFAMASVFALAGALAIVDAFGQHATSFQPEWLGLVVHSLHLMSMALWLGGVLAIAAAEVRVPHSKILLVAGSTLATSAITGAAMALVHVQTPAAVSLSTYGQALGVKQLFVLLAIVSAWRAVRDKRSGWLMAEAGGLIALVAVAGLLVSLPPPH